MGELTNHFYRAAFSDYFLYLVDRVENRCVFIHMALCRWKFSALHRVALLLKMLNRMRLKRS